MRFFPGNREVLTQRFPGIESLIPTPGAPGPWEFKTGPRGHLTVVYEGKPLHSLYDPGKEAGNWVRALPDSLDYILVTGFGLGYHLEELQRLRPQIPVLVAEPHLEFFAQILDHRDLRSILANPRFSFLLGPDTGGLGAFQELFPRHRWAELPLKAYHPAADAYFQKLRREADAGALHRGVNQRTWDRFSGLWARNWVRNIHHLRACRGVNSLAGQGRGWTAVVAAAGPSLEDALAGLKKNRERILLIAVDTAGSRLRAAGIAPDFLVMMDGQYWNSRHGDTAPPEETLVVCELTSHPRALRLAPGRTYLTQGSSPLAQGLETFFPPLGDLTSGGSVATTAWSLACSLEVDQVFFCGLDLAYPQGETHVKGSLFEERLHWFSQRFKPGETGNHRELGAVGLMEIPGVLGGTVWTDPRMEIYRRWFEVAFMKPGPGRFNTSTRGAHIAGLPFQDLKALDQVSPGPPRNFHPGEVFNPLDYQRGKEHLRQALKKILRGPGASQDWVQVFHQAGLGPWAQAALAPWHRLQNLFPSDLHQQEAQAAAQNLQDLAQVVLQGLEERSP